MATLYETLGVSPSASEAELRAAYNRAARSCDLDNLQGASPVVIARAGRTLQAVNEAWRVLRDPFTRAAYDASLSGEEGAGSER